LLHGHLHWWPWCLKEGVWNEVASQHGASCITMHNKQTLKQTPSNWICMGKFAAMHPTNWARSQTKDHIYLEGDTDCGTSNFGNNMVS
jgi:hypothetical protein